MADSKIFERETAEMLFNQWNDVLYSGLIKDFEVLTNSLIQEHGEGIIKSREKKVEALSLTPTHRKSLKTKVLHMVTSKLGKVPQAYRSRLKNYLQSSANRGGQDVLDAIESATGKRLPAFKLSNGYYKTKLNNRVKTLVTAMDGVTKIRLSNALMKGFDNKETKTEMVERLKKAGITSSEYRATMIVNTETAAIHEYMRHETAKLNGVQMKRWITTGEKPCDVCKSLSKKTVTIDSDFASGHTTPPAHPNCDCTLGYSIQDMLCGNYIRTKKTLLERLVDETFSKSSPEEYESQETMSSCVNPEAVWTGGQALFGKDKLLLSYAGVFDDVSQVKKAYKLFDEQELETVAKAVQELDVSDTTDVKELKRALSRTNPLLDLNYSDDQFRIIQARAGLTDEGFLQFLRMFGVQYYTPKQRIL